MFKGYDQLNKVILNEGLRKIRYGSFKSCSELEHINLPTTLVEIGSYAFQYCSSLKKVVLNEGLQTIGYESFYGCQNLEHITFPSTVTVIGDYAFCGCIRLKTVTLNEGLKKVGESAFYSCTSLKSITIPQTVTEIKRTFYNCRNLREVGLHEGIQKIGSRAFEDCSSLERVMFPTLSTRLESITRAGQKEVKDKIDNIRGDLVERRGSELFVSASSLLGEISRCGDAPSLARNWKTIQGILDQIDKLLTYYELKEATTLLGLAMWKAKIDQAEVKPPINLDVYRIDIPGPVKNSILQYLYFRV